MGNARARLSWTNNIAFRDTFFRAAVGIQKSGVNLLKLFPIFVVVGATCFCELASERNVELMRDASGHCDRETFVIVLDVGHTPEAPGAISARGIPEYYFNLRLAEKIKGVLVARGFRKIYRLILHGGAESLVLRSGEAKRLHADLFLSIHHDSVQPQYLQEWTFRGKKLYFDSRQSGFSLFVSLANPFATKSLQFARFLGSELQNKGFRFSPHHAEQEARTIIDAAGVYEYNDLYVLRTASYPAVLLEAGVIVNPYEELRLETSELQLKISNAVADAIQKFCESPE
jgi:N-acetylmuramoyl-L-alanine amidase